MRSLVSGFLLLAALSLAPSVAGAACVLCSAGNYCQNAAVGALWCNGTGIACAQVGRCPNGGVKGIDAFGARPTAVSMTLHRAHPRSPATFRSLRVHHGPAPLDPASGRQALAMALGDPQLAGPAEGVQFVTGGSGLELALEDAAGAALRVAAGGEPGALRVRIAGSRELTGIEPIGDDEVIVRRVTLSDGDWWVVARVTPLSGDLAAGNAELRRLQDALYREVRLTGVRRAPVFEAKPDGR